jgi:hypothetical protein
LARLIASGFQTAKGWKPLLCNGREISAPRVRAALKPKGRFSSLKVAVAEALLSERAVDSAGDGVAKPNDGADEEDGQSELQCVDHFKGTPNSLLVTDD